MEFLLKFTFGEVYLISSKFSTRKWKKTVAGVRRGKRNPMKNNLVTSEMNVVNAQDGASV